jgi:acyl-CoA thioesterase-1
LKYRQIGNGKPKNKGDHLHTLPIRLAVVLLGVAAAAGCGTDYADVTNLQSAGTDIVCFGDSITRGYGASPGQDYPAQLSRLLGVPVINAGRDGDTTESALERLEEDVLSLNPRLVVVELGGNDFLNKVPHDKTFANLDRIVGACQGSGAMVVLVHAKFGLWSDPYWDGMKKIADERGVPVVKKALSGILGNPQRMYDQIHPNSEGYALLAERVAETVEPLLEAADAARAEPAGS